MHSVSLIAKRFLFDRFALGIVLNSFGYSGAFSEISAGPAMSYHFWNSGSVASYIGASYSFGLNKDANDGVANGNLGLDIFVAPTVAVGPSLFYNRYFYGTGSFGQYGSGVNINVYL